MPAYTHVSCRREDCVTRRSFCCVFVVGPLVRSWTLYHPLTPSLLVQLWQVSDSDMHRVTMAFRVGRSGYRDIPIDKDAQILRFEDEESSNFTMIWTGRWRTWVFFLHLFRELWSRIFYPCFPNRMIPDSRMNDVELQLHCFSAQRSPSTFKLNVDLRICFYFVHGASLTLGRWCHAQWFNDVWNSSSRIFRTVRRPTSAQS